MGIGKKGAVELGSRCGMWECGNVECGVVEFVECGVRSAECGSGSGRRADLISEKSRNLPNPLSWYYLLESSRQAPYSTVQYCTVQTTYIDTGLIYVYRTCLVVLVLVVNYLNRIELKAVR